MEPPYRETVERRAVICPTCQRPVEIDRETTATCAQCDTQFATRDATTLVEYNATRHLVLALEQRAPARRGMTAATRWTLTGGVIAAIVGATALFGFAGFTVAFCAAFGLGAVVSARSQTYLR